jgi:hypothetical protein
VHTADRQTIFIDTPDTTLGTFVDNVPVQNVKAVDLPHKLPVVLTD